MASLNIRPTHFKGLPLCQGILNIVLSKKGRLLRDFSGSHKCMLTTETVTKPP